MGVTSDPHNAEHGFSNSIPIFSIKITTTKPTFYEY